MLIKNGNVFLSDPARFEKTDIRVENQTITEVDALSPLPGEEVRDAEGLYVLPGFVDIHIHGFAGADTVRGEEQVRHMSRELRKTGVAASIPTRSEPINPGPSVTAIAVISSIVNLAFSKHSSITIVIFLT